MILNITFSQTSSFPVALTDDTQPFSAAVGAVQARYVEHAKYDGETEITPSSVAQTLYTADLVVEGNITIKPIPSDWGHISWSGRGIRVS